ncbi:hypothetical protein N8J89_17910 [Crossiella sp. CA-258035]|uniref:hypothetical protein n=1 Tax=Crossiella sp. CA-258035 TaxID=2981138 RepID=UPI0024BC0957|nr:hypothetical protein [Crossiella sp. CA-258035]WHT22868.1 hypothetical protein N8J89_17910 [Crossiella sp. CA-258035]
MAGPVLGRGPKLAGRRFVGAQGNPGEPRYGAAATRLATTATTRATGSGGDCLARQAEAIWGRGWDPLNRLGQRWAGDGGERNWRSHASAFAALVAAR